MRKPKKPEIPAAFPNRYNAGMNLRDHFAAIALPIILTSRPDDSAEKKTAAAYEIADAMLKQREIAGS